MHDSGRERYFEFREKYPEFIFSGYRISESEKTLGLDFHFIIPGLAEFRPHWDMAKPGSYALNQKDSRLDKLVFSLGMVELASYWKTTCSPVVRIECGELTEDQSAWWKKLYMKGLGEFFYTNGIDADDDFMRITCKTNDQTSGHSSGFRAPKDNTINHGAGNENDKLSGNGKLSGSDNHSGASNLNGNGNLSGNNNTKTLIPVGGGKDSAVTLELLKDYAERFCYMINPGKAMLDTVSASAVPVENTIIATRTLDENMLALNKQGFLNGHTPFSALVAFSSVLAAYIYGIEYVALSNESSANEPTVMGVDVNHQYSKSFEFESDFITYEARYISSGVKYFSLLRPLTEIGIARNFSRLEKYHSVFRSCNAGSKKGEWCAGCAKCLFVYIILSPFLPEDKLLRIFGKNMLNDPGLTVIFEKLIGLRPEKPFECVGSRDEVNAALLELVRQHESDNAPLPELLRLYKGFEIAGNYEIMSRYDITEMCDSYDGNNHVPERFIPAVKRQVETDRSC